MAAARDRGGLRALVDANVAKFNVVNCVTAVQAFARTGGAGSRATEDALYRRSAEVFLEDEKNSACEPRHVSSVLWALAKLAGNNDRDRSPAGEALLEAAVRRGASFEVERFQSSEISLSVWALGKVNYTTAPACAFAKSLVASLEARKLRLAPQGLGSLLHGLGNLAPVLGPQKLAHVVDRLHAARTFLNAQELANALAGLSKVELVNVPDAAWFAGFKPAFQQTAANFLPQHIANLVAAIARFHERAGHEILDPIDALGPQIRDAAPRMNPQELAMTLWGLAGVVAPSDPRLGDLVEELERQCSTRLASRFDAHALSTIALALGKLDRPFFVRQIDLQMVRGIRRWKAPDADSLAVAFAKVGRDDSSAGTVLLHVGNLVADDADNVPVRNLANITWGVAKSLAATADAGAAARVDDLDSFLQKMASLARKHLDAFNARDLANFAWALATLGFRDSSFMQALGDAASVKLSDFNAQECSKLLFALNKSNVRHAALEGAASSSRVETFEFPAAKMSIRIEHILAGGRNLQQKRESTGATGATGGAIWESSFVLAEWLSRRDFPSARACLAPILAQTSTSPTDFLASLGQRETTVVELGAGMGLCSIVAAKLGATVISSDGDDQVLRLLRSNIDLNEVPNARAAALEWSCQDPVQALGLRGQADVILATGVVYGRDAAVWKNLVNILHKLAHERTVVVLGHGNGAAPGVHQLKGEFYTYAKKHFACHALPSSQVHKDHRGCQIHVLVPKGAHSGKKRSRPDSSEGADAVDDAKEVSQKDDGSPNGKGKTGKKKMLRKDKKKEKRKRQKLAKRKGDDS